jgi:cytoskeleton protein RodZ
MSHRVGEKIMDETEPLQDALFPPKVGERLRTAREAAGYDLNDVGTRTRIPMRHLEAIERSDHAALPSVTYALGFSKAYARAVGLDEAAIGRDMRAELGMTDPATREAQPYQPADPARVPGRLLAWTAVALAALVAIGYTAWRADLFQSRSSAPIAATDPLVSTPAPTNAPSTPAVATPAPSATGQVVLTATSPVWLRVTDATKTRLFEKEMAAGETYQVPANANGPVIKTGRADALKVTIDGREVATLGPAERTISDVGISAAALAARAPVATPPAPVAQ